MGRGSQQSGSGGERKMGAVTTLVLAVAGLILGWVAVEVAFKPYLDMGRDAINRDLDPDYDPDDELPGASGSQDGKGGPDFEATNEPKESKESKDV